jgi:hypothetical protein
LCPRPMPSGRSAGNISATILSWKSLTRPPGAAAAPPVPIEPLPVRSPIRPVRIRIRAATSCPISPKTERPQSPRPDPAGSSESPRSVAAVRLSPGPPQAPLSPQRPLFAGNQPGLSPDVWHFTSPIKLRSSSTPPIVLPDRRFPEPTAANAKFPLSGVSLRSHGTRASARPPAFASMTSHWSHRQAGFRSGQARCPRSTLTVSLTTMDSGEILP